MVLPTQSRVGDNIIAALERNDRICQIRMKPDLQWEKLLDAMQEPFPALTHLILLSDIEIAPVVFMGGSRLQYLQLERVPILGLPKLLLFTSSSPSLSASTFAIFPNPGTFHPRRSSPVSPRCQGLKYFHWDSNPLDLAPNRENSRHLPPPTRSVFPALIKLHFPWSQRLFGGPRGSDRFSSTRLFG